MSLSAEQPCARFRHGIPGIVAAYAAFAGLWILLSDWMLEWLFDDADAILLASTVKGWLFVLVTAVLLYGLLRRLSGAGARLQFARPGLPFLLLAAVIVAITAFAMQHRFSQQKELGGARLQAIADLKQRQISEWLAEREQDAKYAGSMLFTAGQVHPGSLDDQAARDHFVKRLGGWYRSEGFVAAMLLDAQGAVLWRSDRASLQLAPPLHAAVRQAAADGRMHRVGPYRGVAGKLRLDYVVPLVAAGARPPLLVLQVDPGDWLQNTLQAWPVPTASGETSLSRRDGDQVLFLNELRHRRDAAAKFRVPLATPNLVAGMALRGQVRTGTLYEGLDYRGVPSFAVAQAVAGSDWMLLAKMDRSELYAEAVRDSIWIGLTGLLALFMAAAASYLQRQHRQLDLAAATEQSQAERLRALRLLASIADGSEDAIFAKDPEGRYVLFNRAAAGFVGLAAEDVLGHDDTDLFPADQAAQLQAFDRKVLAENRIVVHEESLTTPAGEVSFHSTKGPLHDEAGQVIGSFGIARDITARKQALADQARLVADLTATLTAIPDLLFEVDADGRYLDVKASEESGLAAPREALIGRTVAQMLPPEAAATIMAALDSAARQGSDYGRSIVLPLPGGDAHFELSVARKSQAAGQAPTFIVLSRDITERRRAEQALRDSEAMFRAMTGSAQDAILMMDGQGRITFWNPAAEKIFGYPQAAALGRDLHGLIAPERFHAAFVAGFRNFLVSGTGAVVGKTVEIVGKRVDGSEIPVELSISAVQIKGEWGAAGILRDISVRKRTELALRDSEARSALAQESAHVGIWELDLRTGALYWSPELKRLYGVAAEDEPSQEAWYASVHPEDRARIDARWTSNVARGEHFSVEFRYLRRDTGEWRWIASLGRASYGADGRPATLAGINMDITERKAAEAELSARNAELERFNRASIGRELDMIELKKQVNALSRELGREPPYSLAFLDENQG